MGWLVGYFALQHINPFWVIQRQIKFLKIQFSTSIVFFLQIVKCQNSSILNNSV